MRTTPRYGRSWFYCEQCSFVGRGAALDIHQCTSGGLRYLVVSINDGQMAIVKESDVQYSAYMNAIGLALLDRDNAVDPDPSVSPNAKMEAP